MIEYLRAEKNDKEEIIDFINYVFSQNFCPHDFKTLLPKAYSDDVCGIGAQHYVVKEDGKIKATVAIRTIDFDLLIESNILFLLFLSSFELESSSSLDK